MRPPSQAPRRVVAALTLTLTMILPRGLDRAHAKGPTDRSGPAQARLRAVFEGRAAGESTEAVLQRAIAAGDGALTLSELTTVVQIGLACCRGSAEVSGALTRWLRESHPIYAGRLPSEASQFRGFLLVALGGFRPSAELYSYVKTELLFAGHAFGIAAAAVAARGFADRADELVPLMEPFLRGEFDDERVDLTTPELSYPIVHPTKARYEIIRTLRAFGASAHRAVPLLDAIVACPTCGSYGGDAVLVGEAAAAAEQLRRTPPPCCGKAVATSRGLQIIDRRDRKPLSAGAMKLLDQDGRSLELADLRGRPFALTFFYSQCTNALKCVATVRRLRALEDACAKDELTDRVGIYGMTYDPHFDSPSVLKKYGTLHGMQFADHARLLKTVGELGPAFRDQLALRVSYGAGSINQHGIQLFVFDKQGRLAASHDNELWSPIDVKNCLARLAAE